MPAGDRVAGVCLSLARGGFAFAGGLCCGTFGDRHATAGFVARRFVCECRFDAGNKNSGEWPNRNYFDWANHI
jgi:hypothetical protein